MIFYAQLRPSPTLSNIRYKWQYGNTEGDEQTIGITQPTSFPLFRISAEPPANAERILVYDSNDVTNWTSLAI